MFKRILTKMFFILLLLPSVAHAGISFVCNPIKSCGIGVSTANGAIYSYCDDPNPKDPLAKFRGEKILFLKVHDNGVRIQDPSRTSDIHLVMDVFDIGFDNINTSTKSYALFSFFGKKKVDSYYEQYNLSKNKIMPGKYYSYQTINVKKNLNYREGRLTITSFIEKESLKQNYFHCEQQ